MDDIKPEEKSELTRARLQDSLDWMNTNVYPKMEQVYKAYQCVTDPIYKTVNGKKVEDKSRTNVCMPTISVMVRKNVARLTANPPNIAYRCSNEETAAKLNAWRFMQYDRSGEARQHRRLIGQGELFGWSVGKLYWDTVEYYRQVREQIMKGEQPAVTDRLKLLQGAGLPQQDIEVQMEQARQMYGADSADKMNPDEIANYIANYGPELVTGNRVKKYEGPCTKVPFCGDFFKQPGAYTLDESDYTLETFTETDLFLQKMTRKQFTDPETGQMRTVFDKNLVEKFLESDPKVERKSGGKDLRQRFRAILGMAEPEVQKRLLKTKRFDIVEHHSRRDDGSIWIEWYGGANADFFLGEMPYPWDLYGHFAYTEYQPIPDVISPFGTSIPILLRHLHDLHNVTVGQRTDLVTKNLRPEVIVNRAEDIPEEAVERGGMRVYAVKGGVPNTAWVPGPNVPQSAWETEAQLLRVMAMAAPELNTVDAGTQGNPQAGKTATTAILNAKSNDVLTQDKMNAINLYLKESGEKSLWMLQQSLSEDGAQIDKRYMQDKALSERYGETAVITLDPYEIQEDIEVEPQAMSMLAVDDELKQDKAMKFYTLASQNPSIFNLDYAADFLISTMPGVDPTKAKAPKQDTPQMPETRMNVSLSIAFKDLPVDVQNQLLPMIGLQPSQELALQSTLDGIEKLNKAGAAATELTQPQPTPGEVPQDAQGVRQPNVPAQ